MKIVFSILVHENVNCILSLINNIKKFCPNSLIVIHISNNNLSDAQLQNIENVFVNPTRNIIIKYEHGLLHCYLSNYKYVCEKVGKENISNFVFMSSNEMIIKYGLEEHIKKYKNGLQCVCHNQFVDWHIYNRNVQNTLPIEKKINMLDMDTIWGGQTEGQFYETDVMDKICEVFEKCFSNEKTDYPSEEIIPQTVFMSMEKSLKCPNITFQTYSHSLNMTIDIVKLFINSEKQNEFILLPSSNKMCLSTPHAGNKIKYIFCVKRIERNENDPVRCFINNL